MAVASVGLGAVPLGPIGGAVRNLRDSAPEVELRRGELWRSNGDNRWRMIVCLRGVVWVTQERDLQDYVLTAGQMFLVSIPGPVLVQTLQGSMVQITPSLKATPYIGRSVSFG